jgi:F-type H+-transporting ATPase subunit delta
MLSIVASRYAKALLSVGLESGEEENFASELEQFNNSLKQVGPEAKALLSPIFPKAVRIQILEAVLAKADLSPTVANFLRLLNDRGRLDILDSAVEVYRKLLDENQGLIHGLLTSASPLSESDVSAVKAALSTLTGRRVELNIKQDPSLIGGLVASLGDLRVDSSLSSQLEKLERLLTQ